MVRHIKVQTAAKDIFPNKNIQLFLSFNWCKLLQMLSSIVVDFSCILVLIAISLFRIVIIRANITSYQSTSRCKGYFFEQILSNISLFCQRKFAAKFRKWYFLHLALNRDLPCIKDSPNLSKCFFFSDNGKTHCRCCFYYNKIIKSVLESPAWEYLYQFWNSSAFYNMLYRFFMAGSRK